MRVTIDLMKKSTQIIDLSNVINPRVGDDDLLLPLHIIYGDNQTDMRGKDVEFLSNDPNKKNIYIAGTCNTNTPGDNLYMGNLTFRFPAGTFQADGTYDPDKTMFRIVDKATQKVISSVNVKITVMKNSIEFDFDPDKTSYDSRLETMLHDFHDKGQTMLDEIKDLNNQAKSNVSGDTATTANQAKQQADANAGDISDLKGEVTGARGRFADLPGREDAQDTAIGQKETIVNANANYAALKQKDAQQDAVLAQKAGKFELEDKLAQMSLEPEAFENETALKAKYPNGKPGIMVTADTGHKWIWAKNQWNDAGVYQSSSALLKINTKLFTPDTVPNGYKDLNTFPMNEIVSFSGDAKSILTNLPDDFPSGYVNMTVITYGYDLKEINNGTSQTIIASDAGVTFSHMYFRSLSKNSKGVQSGGWVSDGQDKLKQAIRSDKILYTDDNLPDNLKDLNQYPVNKVISFSGHAKSLLINLPDSFPDDYVNMSVMTYGFSEEIGNGTCQTIILSNDGVTYSRMYFRSLSRNSKGVQSGGWINDGQDDLKRAIKSDKGLYTEDKLPDELKDFNTYPMNSNISYSGNVVGVIKNAPQDLVAGRYYNMGIFTLSFANSSVVDNGTVQYLSLEWSSNTGVSSATYARTLGRNANGIVAPAWQKLSDNYENGSLSLFSKIGVIGDSYASGCITADGADGSDRYQISWPQIMGRACGAQVTNFTHGGANTGLWTTEDYGMAKMKAADPQDLYICALGINDAANINRGEEAMGSIDDVGSTTSTTFYRYYSDIIKAIQEKAPHACIVMTTLVYSPMTMGNLDKMNAAIKELANHFKIPCIDLQNDDFFTSSFYANAIQAEAAHSHPTAPVYAGMAKRMQALIENDMVVHKNYYDQFPWGHPSLDAPKISVEG